MICMVLTDATIRDTLDTAVRHAEHCDAYELRVDCLDEGEREMAGTVPARLLQAGIQAPVILAIRRSTDGGRFSGAPGERQALLIRALTESGEAPFFAVDLEEDFDPPSVREAAGKARTAVIRSIYDFNTVPADLASRLNRMTRDPSEIVRAEVMVNSTADLLRLCTLSAGLGSKRRIILGMGPWGFPSRILAGRLGSMFAFTMAPGRVSSGDIDPETLDTLYRYRSINGDTALFAVIGNPVMHSRSPQYHNARFSEDSLNAVYFPVQVDRIEDFFDFAGFLGIQGVSVTIPHKEAVLPFLSVSDDAVEAIGACNTVVRTNSGVSPSYSGTNSDVPGFLRPLLRLLDRRDLRGLRATVIGAGGAARGVVYSLLAAGASVRVVNRTAQRAQALTETLAPHVADGAELLWSKIEDGGAMVAGEYTDLIVQTTSVGMHPHVEDDPIPFYEFSGREVVCDIIYTPEMTTLLGRAQKAGCRILGGRAMFDEQAAEQYRLFHERVV